jgi:hypothetical protein
MLCCLRVVPGLSGSDETFCSGRACCPATGNGIPATNKPLHTTHTRAFFNASIATSDAQMNY